MDESSILHIDEFRVHMMENSSETVVTQKQSTNTAVSLSTSIQIALCLVLMFVIIIGNLFVAAAYVLNARIRTGTYTILVSLAISDLLVGCISLPLWIYISWTNDYSVSNTVFVCFDIFSALASIFHLTTVSTERWFAISRPFVYKTLTTRHYSLALCGAWLTALAIAAIGPLVTLKERRTIYVVFLLLVSFVGPGFLISLLNYSIFKVVRRLMANLPASTQQESDESIKVRKNIKKQRRTALTLAFVTVMFLISWSSFFIINTTFVFCNDCGRRTTLTPLYAFAKWLQYSNSAMNPVVYAFRDVEMRKTFVRILGPCGRVFRKREILPVRPAPRSGSLNGTTIERL